MFLFPEEQGEVLSAAVGSFQGEAVFFHEPDDLFFLHAVRITGKLGYRQQTSNHSGLSGPDGSHSSLFFVFRKNTKSSGQLWEREVFNTYKSKIKAHFEMLYEVPFLSGAART